MHPHCLQNSSMISTDAIFDFLLPTRCVVCSRRPSLICDSCRPSPELFFYSNILSATTYDSKLAAVLSGYKERQLVALHKSLVPLANQVIDQIRSSFEITHIAFPASSRRNFQKRGFEPIHYLLARVPAANGLKLVRAARSREVLDQAGLSRIDRIQNQSGSSLPIKLPGAYLAFDDVLSTGSTMAELAKSIESGGAKLVASAVLAVNILKPA